MVWADVVVEVGAIAVTTAAASVEVVSVDLSVEAILKPVWVFDVVVLVVSVTAE